ncbi:hypothetical protein CBOM_00923 [Ceraceosorus bombacis]|uniref:Transmembrane protein n=1 Tax=Ceraceosorus bombacis TaxID=401625 RepID=A0A0P1BAC9_9BASI|nr:hypothetical protein CBOM_00923 [Ceraceosorus bombacis]
MFSQALLVSPLTIAISALAFGVLQISAEGQPVIFRLSERLDVPSQEFEHQRLLSRRGLLGQAEAALEHAQASRSQWNADVVQATRPTARRGAFLHPVTVFRGANVWPERLLNHSPHDSAFRSPQSVLDRSGSAIPTNQAVKSEAIESAQLTRPQVSRPSSPSQAGLHRVKPTSDEVPPAESVELPRQIKKAKLSSMIKSEPSTAEDTPHITPEGRDRLSTPLTGASASSIQAPRYRALPYAHRLSALTGGSPAVLPGTPPLQASENFQVKYIEAIRQAQRKYVESLEQAVKAEPKRKEPAKKERAVVPKPKPRRGAPLKYPDRALWELSRPEASGTSGRTKSKPPGGTSRTQNDLDDASANGRPLRGSLASIATQDRKRQTLELFPQGGSVRESGSSSRRQPASLELLGARPHRGLSSEPATEGPEKGGEKLSLELTLGRPS